MHHCISKDNFSLHLGYFGNCTSNNLCGEDGGDCDHNSECKEGHKCGTDNCRSFLGFHSQFDCCFSTEEDFCTVEKPCGVHQGDCDYNVDCLEGFICGFNNCQGSLGYDPEVDCCYEALLGEEDFCAAGIPCAVDEGDCDSNEECENELFCGSNNCPNSHGFDLEVDCCFALTSNTIISPNYPNPYPNSAVETWILNADIGSKINLQFQSFQVGTGTYIIIVMPCKYSNLLTVFL